MSQHKPFNSHLIATVVTACVLALVLLVLGVNFGLMGGDGGQPDVEAMDDETFTDLEDLILEDFEFKVSAPNSPAETENQLADEASQNDGVMKEVSPSTTTVLEESLKDLKPEPAVIDTMQIQKAPVAELKIDTAKTVLEVDSAIADLLTMMSEVKKGNKADKSSSQKTAKERMEFYKNNYRLIRNFQKVYPYALKTREVIELANEQLATTQNESAKKKLIKQMEDDLFAEYEGAVRKMSVSQGKLLLKLIARETNKTGYELIKEYRGAFSASFWYGVGRIFGTDLKTKYDQKEDSVIETVLDKYKKNELY